MAVLDVSAIDPELSEGAHALTGALTEKSARAIEERFFREQFRHAWIVAAAPSEPGAPGMLLAVDGSHRIVGANRAARRSLMLDDRRLRAGVGFWTIFEGDAGIFWCKDRNDVYARLLLAGSEDSFHALVTPPDRAVGAARHPANLQTHPRLDSIQTHLRSRPARQACGGLSAGAMRRAREYMEAHLGERIDLPMLAVAAGLSVHHFARQFKQSTGVTPHHYLTHKRVEHAQEMLARTDLPLSEIALAAGFSDQSHLARHFRYVLGITPREFRRSHR